jgi:hypothetical protein
MSFGDLVLWWQNNNFRSGLFIKSKKPIISKKNVYLHF